MSLSTIYEHDPDDVGLPFGCDWKTKWEPKEGLTIVSAVWDYDDTLDLLPDPDFAPSLINGVASICVKGGTVGRMYRFTCRGFTATGAHKDESIFIKVVHH